MIVLSKWSHQACEALLERVHSFFCAIQDVSFWREADIGLRPPRVECDRSKFYTLLMLRYQEQDSSQTLREGLAEYYETNVGGVTKPSDLPPESAALFRSHDLCHVIFGLGTSLADETLVDTRTFFSCDVGMRRYTRYLTVDQAAKALFKELGYANAVWITLLSLPRICRAALEAIRMTKRWPWVPPGSFLDRPIADLRREFGIRVV